MKTKFESKEEIKSWMFLFGGIPFVEPARVQEAFDLILSLKPDTDETLVIIVFVLYIFCIMKL
jgi:hypothetical protein